MATRNRSPLLELALQGLSTQTLSRDLYEVVVVDNGSSDDTSQRLKTWSQRCANIRCVVEPRVGLSVARNTGWRLTSAPYVAFLDDDAIPAPDWLERLLSAFVNTTPRPACIGGRVDPIFDTTPPSWMTGHLLDYLSVVDHSPTPMFLTDIIHRQKLAGVNMAVDRCALEQVQGFSTRLGRVGTHLMSGEDVLVQLQLEQLGLPVYYDPSIVVRHRVIAARMTEGWLEQRSYLGGVSDALLSYFSAAGHPFRAARTFTWGVRSILLSPRSTFVPRDLQSRCQAKHRWGFLMGGLQALYASIRGRLGAP